MEQINPLLQQTKEEDQEEQLENPLLKKPLAPEEPPVVRTEPKTPGALFDTPPLIQSDWAKHSIEDLTSRIEKFTRPGDVGKLWTNLKRQVPEFLKSLPYMVESLGALTPEGSTQRIAERMVTGILGKEQQAKQEQVGIIREALRPTIKGLSTIKDFVTWFPSTVYKFAKDPIGFTEEQPLDVLFLLGGEAMGKAVKSRGKLTGKEVKNFARDRILREVADEPSNIRLADELYKNIPDDAVLDFGKAIKKNVIKRAEQKKINPKEMQQLSAIEQRLSKDPGMILTDSEKALLKKHGKYVEEPMGKMARNIPESEFDILKKRKPSDIDLARIEQSDFLDYKYAGFDLKKEFKESLENMRKGYMVKGATKDRLESITFDKLQEKVIADTIKTKPPQPDVILDYTTPGMDTQKIHSHPLRKKVAEVTKQATRDETILKNDAIAKGVAGADIGIIDWYNKVPRYYGDLKTLMETPDLSTMANVPLTSKNFKKVAGVTRNALTNIVHFKKKNPIFDALHDYYLNADRAYTREISWLKKDFTQRWKKEIAQEGLNPKQVAERITVYLTGKQPHGKAILDYMGKKPLADIEMRPIELRIIGEARERFDNVFRRINHAREKAGKDPIKYIKDYVTWMRDFEGIREWGGNFIEDPNYKIEMKSTAFRFDKRYAMEFPSRIETNFFNIFDRYMKESLNHVHMSPVIAKGRSYFKTIKLPTGELTKSGKPKYVSWNLKRDKPAFSEFLNEWLNRIAGKANRPDSTIGLIANKIVTKLNKNLAAAILSYNIRSALIQFSAIRGSIVENGYFPTVRGMYDNLNPYWRNFATKHSKHLPGRNYDIHVAKLIERTTGGKLENIRRAFAETGLKPLQLLDMETARATWLTFYRKYLKKNGHQQAVKLADDAVLRTQMSGKIGDIAHIQATPLGRAISLFQTFTIGEWNWLLRDIMGFDNPNINLGTKVVRTMRFITTTVLMNAFFENILNIPSPFPAPEQALIRGIKEGKPTKEVLGSVGLEMLEQLPIVGGAIKYSQPYSRQLPSPTAQTIGDIVGLVNKVVAMKEPNIHDLETIGKIFGIPGSSQVRKFISRIKRGESIPGALLGVQQSSESESGVNLNW